MSNKWEATFHPEGQIMPTPAQESTDTASQPESGPHPTPDATGAGEALVQQIAVIVARERSESKPDDWDMDAARAVLPLVEAQVAPLRDERDLVRACWKIDMRAAREAESALRQVREDLTALADEFASRGAQCDEQASETEARGDTIDAHEWAESARVYRACAGDVRGLARVGAVDTQPEGAGALRRIRALLAMREENDVRDEDGFAVVRVDDVRAMFPPHACEGDGTCIHCGADEPPAWSTRRTPTGPCFAACDEVNHPGREHAEWLAARTPTAGSNGDTAPEADKCWRHDYGHREYVCRCDPPREGDTGMVAPTAVIDTSRVVRSAEGGPVDRESLRRLRPAVSNPPADTAPESGEGR